MPFKFIFLHLHLAIKYFISDELHLFQLSVYAHIWHDFVPDLNCNHTHDQQNNKKTARAVCSIWSLQSLCTIHMLCTYFHRSHHQSLCTLSLFSVLLFFFLVDFSFQQNVSLFTMFNGVLFPLLFLFNTYTILCTNTNTLIDWNTDNTKRITDHELMICLVIGLFFTR